MDHSNRMCEEGVVNEEDKKTADEADASKEEKNDEWVNWL